MLMYLLNRAMWIAILSALLGAVLVLHGHDQRHRQAAAREYCESVAIWLAEEARGIAPEHRTGHPDYEEIAVEQCPGLRPAYPADAQPTPRQLAQD